MDFINKFLVSVIFFLNVTTLIYLWNTQWEMHYQLKRIDCLCDLTLNRTEAVLDRAIEIKRASQLNYCCSLGIATRLNAESFAPDVMSIDDYIYKD